MSANKYGLTQLQNFAQLPPIGAVIFAGPLPIVGGSGSPTRMRPSSSAEDGLRRLALRDRRPVLPGSPGPTCPPARKHHHDALDVLRDLYAGNTWIPATAGPAP